MNIIIVGCGKTGRALASELDSLGHDVAVVDRDKEKFEQLPDDFDGICVQGNGIDADVLKNAGCENADCAVVITENDNVNIMAAEILNKIFGIDDVYVRIFDSSRESVFRKFGLDTVCSTRMERDAFLSLVLGKNSDIQPVSISGTNVGFNMIRVEKRHLGKKPSEIFCKEGEMLFAVKKKNGTLQLSNEAELTFEEGDKLIYAVIQR